MNTKLPLFMVCAALLAPAAWAGNDHPHWSYTGPTGTSHWAELDQAYQTCALGKHQSPIDIRTGKARRADLKPIGFGYAAAPGTVVNNGHTVQINLPAAGQIDLDGVPYKLLQFHFHTPSEEKINGKTYPLVAHLVHQNAEGKLAVVAVLFKSGRENAALKPVFASLPAHAGESRELPAPLDVAALLPAQQAYWSFTGSLTTPPCSEDVRWQVLKTPVEVSPAQLAAFRKLYPMNARPVQPLNGRTVQASR
ncbi:carbonic anhydrase family protein [Cupriavidus taiwanensis]|uniref:carbonic anhydrase n=1 Tax=Cupriavidus taiwanensis TaxID=164546 RepID=UPI001574AC84|nr:carbonic anhydrase family protein [Cupriavidus taiwanensis]NSX18111.1 carbonic anhydrase family protein [Cupriavidus taiwanensis]